MPASIIDIVPATDSAETLDNSEPSVAVDPANPSQLLAGAFGEFVTGSGLITIPFTFRLMAATPGPTTAR
jgi:hypothetical protein